MNKRIVIIDNYDSFTYNLVHLVEEIVDHKIDVFRNDNFDLLDLESYEYIILSPGPGIPSEAGLLKDTIKMYRRSKKIFGVCLGFQAIGEVYGGALLNLQKVWHGIKATMIKTDPKSLILEGINNHFSAGRYHSWVIDPSSNIDDLIITAEDEEGNIMAARHQSDKVYGVQFHPESIMTDDGKRMLENFLNS